MTRLQILETLRRSFSPITVTTDPHRAGVYLLVRADAVVYVGASVDVQDRVTSHIGRKARNSSGSVFPRITEALWMPLPRGSHRAYEGALIRALDPRQNEQVAPQFTGEDNAVLCALGLPEHEDQVANAKRFSTKRRRAQESA